MYSYIIIFPFPIKSCVTEILAMKEIVNKFRDSFNHKTHTVNKIKYKHPPLS